MTALSTHLSHCNFGEHAGSCKYGDDDCPALTDEWSWLERSLQRLERQDDHEMAIRAAAWDLILSLDGHPLAVPLPEAQARLKSLLEVIG